MNDATNKFKAMAEGQGDNDTLEFRTLPSEIGGFKIKQWTPPVYPTNEELCNLNTYFCEFCNVKHEDVIDNKIIKLNPIKKLITFHML